MVGYIFEVFDVRQRNFWTSCNNKIVSRKVLPIDRNLICSNKSGIATESFDALFFVKICIVVGARSLDY